MLALHAAPAPVGCTFQNHMIAGNRFFPDKQVGGIAHWVLCLKWRFAAHRLPENESDVVSPHFHPISPGLPKKHQHPRLISLNKAVMLRSLGSPPADNKSLHMARLIFSATQFLRRIRVTRPSDVVLIHALLSPCPLSVLILFIFAP